MSSVERKRKQLEREAEEAMRIGVGDEFIRSAFFEHACWEDIRLDLKMIGVIDPPDFEEDRDNDPEWDDEETDGRYRGSLGRAERMIDTFHAMAVNLATCVNAFKDQEFRRRMEEIENSDLGDPDLRKRAVVDIAALTRLRDQLKRKTRFEVPSYRLRKK